MATNQNLGAVVRRTRILQLPDGKTIELKALTISDWATIQDEAVQAAKRNLLLTYYQNQDLLPAEKRVELLVEAFKRAEAISAETLTDEQLSAWSDTFRGDMTIMWLSMRGAVPDLTYDQAAEIWAVHKEYLKSGAEAVLQISRPSLGNEMTPPPMAEAAG